ncbi:MAG: HEPN domain-containing protein [Clostridium sp.]|nr:HEPN domain-containing protein [Clostridium sp.]MCM1207505.1 HEPN domain-containing protein [Ruminococcus sp.]
MSKLLNRAKVNRKIVADNYKLISTDDAYLDSCCFNVQQAIEQALKFLIEIYGGVHTEDYDAYVQLNKLLESPVNIPRVSELHNLANTLNNWKMEAWYSESFTASIEDLDKAISIADDIIAFADNSIQQLPLSKMERFPEE